MFSHFVKQVANDIVDEYRWGIMNGLKKVQLKTLMGSKSAWKKAQPTYAFFSKKVIWFARSN